YEAPDQPWTGDAVDFRTLARDPARRLLRKLAAQRQFGFTPCGNAAFEIPYRRTDLAQNGGGSLTDLVAMHAINYDRGFGRDLAAPALDLFGWPADRPGDHPFAGLESRVSAHIDQQRRGGSAKLAIKLFAGNIKTAFIHDRAPSHNEWRRTWTISR